MGKMKTTTFIHTADWQLGKPFAGIHDEANRVLVQRQRIEVLKRITKVAEEQHAGFVLVAGDVFDSPSATKSIVAAACSEIGKMKVPVLVIPGNHDHGGPGSLWGQEFFRKQRDDLAPNLRVLLTNEPVELANAVVLPCPLLRRHEPSDPTAWLRTPDGVCANAAGKPRIILAHGSVQGFSAAGGDEEEESGGMPNQIDLSKLPEAEFDYVALGDWHGSKQVGPKAWYSGTPELDRFPKGADHDPGKVLVVKAGRGVLPQVKAVATASFGWHDLAFALVDDSGIDQLKVQLESLLQGRAAQDLLRLELTGSLGIAAANRLAQELEHLEARLLRLKLSNRVVLAPTGEEVKQLAGRSADPLISQVAARLVERMGAGGNDGEIARLALCELHAECSRP